MAFKKATKYESRLRLALTGPSGSGKTYSALAIATAMGGRIALIDSERGSASKYAHIFSFDVEELASFHPQRYIDAIHEAELAGYDILIIDSLSHAWMGKDGALEQVDRAAKKMSSGNTFAAWKDVTPLQNSLMDAITGARCHVIATLRSKTAYIQEADSRGKLVPKKVGLQPVQRDGVEHEFDVVGELEQDNTLIISKTRCPELQGLAFLRPSQEVAEILLAWLAGEPIPVSPTQQEKFKLTPVDPKPNGGDGKTPKDPAREKNFRALEAKIKETGIDRERLKAYFADPSILLLSPGKDGEIHLHDLKDKNLALLLTEDAWQRCMASLYEWEAARGGFKDPATCERCRRQFERRDFVAVDRQGLPVAVCCPECGPLLAAEEAKREMAGEEAHEKKQVD